MNLIYSNRNQINGISIFKKKNSSKCFSVRIAQTGGKTEGNRGDELLL